MKDNNPFTIKTKSIKILGINLPKETEDLYSEKTCRGYSMKEMKTTQSKWKDILCSDWRINRNDLLPCCNLIDSMQSLSNYQCNELEQKIFQFEWKHKRPEIINAIFEKANWRAQVYDLQTILQKAVIKTIIFVTGNKTQIQISGAG